MFIGHFGAGLMGKKLAPELNLGVLFLTCQWPDLIWPVFVFLGMEAASVDHSATEVTPINFSHYPYSHSLVATLIYAVIAGGIVWRYLRSHRAAVVAGALVVSHWVLDFITHGPDLPLFLGDEKYGLGLWNSLGGTLVVESGIFILGIALYLSVRPQVSRKQNLLFWSAMALMSVIYIANIFGPKAPAEAPAAALAAPALAMWLFVIWGYYADRKKPGGPVFGGAGSQK